MMVQLLAAFQPILSTCVILTKSDVREYILDLLTLSYLFGERGSRKDEGIPFGESEHSTLKGRTGSAFGSGITDFSSSLFGADVDVRSSHSDQLGGNSDNNSSAKLSDGDADYSITDSDIGKRILSPEQIRD